MVTLLDIKILAASYLDLAPSDFTVNGVDLFLAAVNQVRKSAELEHDFEFNRKSVTVTVNGTTGGNLELARDLDNNLVDVKTVIEVGVLDDQGNLIPQLWTTTAESLERQRQDNSSRGYRLWRTDDEGDYRANGQARITFSGNRIMKWPLEDDTADTNYPLWLEAYAFTSDWTAGDLSATAVTVTGTLTPDVTGVYLPAGTRSGSILYVRAETPSPMLYDDGATWIISSYPSGIWTFTTASSSPVGTYTAGFGGDGTATVTLTSGTSDIWTTHGQQYLLWATVVQLNKRYKFFVPRQEGNLTPPTELADAGLAMLVDWDSNKFEQFRRHSR